jgi:hypothetical protein
MLDKRTEMLLIAINNRCGEGSYKVLEKSELINAFPQKFRPDNEGLSDMVNFLCEREYLKCKYSDDNVFCLSPLPKGRLYHENSLNEQKNKFSYRRLVVTAFIGSVLGGVLGAAIHAVVLRFFG